MPRVKCPTCGYTFGVKADAEVTLIDCPACETPFDTGWNVVVAPEPQSPERTEPRKPTPGARPAWVGMTRASAPPAAARPSAPAKASAGDRPLWAQLLLVAVLVSMPFLFWNAGTFDTHERSSGDYVPAPIGLQDSAGRPAGSAQEQALASRLRGRLRDVEVTVRNAPDPPPRKFVIVSWNVGGGRTPTRAKMDVEEILKAVIGSGVDCTALTVLGSVWLVDEAGDESRLVVVHAVYTRPTLERIRRGGLSYEDVYELADVTTIDPAFAD